MTDIFTPEKRSWAMSCIRGQNTKIDLMMSDMLKSIGCIFTMYPKMYGNPDFLVKNKILFFVMGVFGMVTSMMKRKNLRQNSGEQRLKQT